MIVFQHSDEKVLSLLKELSNYNIDGDGVKVRHPILTPFYILQLIFKKRKIAVYVFRYLNDSNSFVLAIMRYLSDALIILILKRFKIDIWWLCHNVDKETTMFYPKIIELRRNLVARYSSLILTTNELLVPKAMNIFPSNLVDSISLGYMEDGALNLDENKEIEYKIAEWIKQRRNQNSKFIFCIGAPAKKSLHFDLISDFIQRVNETSDNVWYAIVIGKEIVDSEFIYNVPFKCVLNKDFIRSNVDFYYRVINDFSMSYSTYEAVHYRIPTITENYGILPELIDKYRIGIVIDPDKEISKQINDFSFDEARFESFELDNNWKVAASKIKQYYEAIVADI